MNCFIFVSVILIVSVANAKPTDFRNDASYRNLIVKFSHDFALSMLGETDMKMSIDEDKGTRLIFKDSHGKKPIFIINKIIT